MRAGNAGLVVAGGMESMTNALPVAADPRRGAAHQTLQDHMFLDGLEDAYDNNRLMGSLAEDCASRYQFSRTAQDEFALRSLERALEAQKTNAFAGEIAPVTVTTRKAETVVSADEQPGKARPEKIPQLKPAFAKDGTVTAANSSSISDGAAALVVTSAGQADAGGMKARARILGHASHSHDPQWFTTAPVPAAQKLMARLGWGPDDVDLWEVNEAFAVVPMAFMHEMGLSAERVNVNGGACVWPSDRGLGKPDHRDIAERSRDARPVTRHRRHLHWRRRGHCHRHRAALAMEGRADSPAIADVSTAGRDAPIAVIDIGSNSIRLVIYASGGRYPFRCSMNAPTAGLVKDSGPTTCSSPTASRWRWRRCRASRKS